MKPHSTDLRTRIVHAVNHEHNTPQEAANRFMTSPASVYRYLQLNRDQGHLEPAAIPGRPRAINDELEPRLRRQLESHNDATLTEHCQIWQEDTGFSVSVTTMYRTIVRLGITRKKNDMPG
jgi:transposase